MSTESSRGANSQVERGADTERAADALLAELSRRFVSVAPNEVDAAVRDALRTVAEGYGADAAAWMELDGPRRLYVPLQIWVDPAVGPVAGDGMPADFIAATLASGPVRFVADVDQTPGLPPWIREQLAAIGARSCAAVPVEVAGVPVATVNFLWRRRSADMTERDLRPLYVLGNVMYEAIARARAERRLSDSEQRLKMAMETARLGTWHWDLAHDTVLRAGTGPLSPGLELQDRALERFLSRVHPEDRAEVHRRLQAAIAGLQDYRMEFRFLRADGSVGWLYTVAQVFRDAGGHAVAVAGVNLDISDRKQMEEELRQARAMEAIGRLAGGVAHDFNNVLSVVLGQAELALHAVDAESPLFRQLSDIRDAADRAARLTRHLLTLGRKQVLELTVLDVNELVRNIERILRCLVREDIQIELALAEEPGLVRADPAQLDQAIVNLVTNARDALPRGGRITISTSETWLEEPPSGPPGGRYVVVAVTDTGSGMDAHTLSRAFEPFFTTKEAGQGIGLGLASVYSVVKQHGGHVSAHSAPGEGSTFRIYLPLTDGVEARPPAPRLSDAELPPSRPDENKDTTVLVVEDEEMVRRLTCEALRELGYQVIDAPSGTEALTVGSSHSGPIDLLLTDVVMPGLNGKELFQSLRAVRPALKVLYMSGYTNDIIAARGILDPGLALLQKPFTLGALASQVEAALGA